jgi:hypothetical protein
MAMANGCFTGLYLDGSSNNYYAIKQVVSTRDMLGITTEAGLAGDTKNITLLAGKHTLSGLTAGQKYAYDGTNYIAGSNNYKIGTAINSTTLLVGV